jgi:plastocyanin
MNLMRIGVLLVGLGLLVTVGCASHPPFPQSSLTGELFDVKIGESLSPQAVTVKRGDEVRWINTTSGPVDISFVKSLDGVVSCQRGFVSTGWGYLFGASEVEFLVIATVHSNDSASLCFSTPGTYPYTVRIDKAPTDKATRITGTVTIE